MTDRNFRDRDRFGREREENWEKDRFGHSGSGGSPERFENQENWGSSRGYSSMGPEYGFNRESMGSRESNRGWGGGAGEDWNRGGRDSWNRGHEGELQRGSYYGGFGSEGIVRGKHSGRGPKGWKRSNERITEEVNEALARHPELDATDIEVRVENGEVTLTGIVEDRGAKRLAEDIAEDVFGVDDVNNDLKIRHGFLAGLTGEKADEREVQRGMHREPSTGATTGRSTNKGGRTGRSELDTR
jgi:hypothetical protein